MVLQAPIWIAQTKFIAPSLRPELISRPRLLAELSRSIENYPLTLVSAPAGSGKTTLLTSLPYHLPSRPVAWLALDELDNEPVRFVNGLTGALRHLQPGFGYSLLERLESQNNLAVEPRSLVASLINDISQDLSQPFALVLDDLHVITDPATLSALDYFIERLPAQARLVVATRYTPPLSLAKLRVRRQLNEIDLNDLQFTLEETGLFFARNSGQALTPDQLRTLHARTQGWAAGLSLLVSSVERRPAQADRTSFINHLNRNNRLVFDFLADEILNSQDQAVRDFLLKTSLLAELSPALCQAVTGRADAANILDELYRRNLFITLVDSDHQTFRYHDLFKEFLRQRLTVEQPGLIPELHRRAASAETVLARRMQHLLGGQLWDEALAQIEREGEKLIKSGAFHMLEGWVEALPDAVKHNRPRLLFLLGACAWTRWDYEGARVYLEQVLKNFQSAGDIASEGETLVLLIACFNSLSRFEDARQAIQQALKLPFSNPRRIELLTSSGWFFLSRGDWEQAILHIKQAVDILEAETSVETICPVLAGHLVTFGPLPGGLEQLERVIRLAKPSQAALPAPYQGLLLGLTGFIRIWRGNFKEAIRLGDEAVEICRPCGGISWLISDVAGYLPVAYALTGQDAAADRHFTELFTELEQPALASYALAWKSSYLYLYGRTRWLQGRLADAQETYNQMVTWENPQEWAIIRYLRLQLKALLDISGERYAEAEQALLEVAAFQAETHTTTLYGDAHLLLAYLYLKWNKPQAALDRFGPVLAAAHAGNRLGSLCWQGKPVVLPLLQLAHENGIEPAVVAALYEKMGETPGQPAATVPAPAEFKLPDQPEVLTPREVEILGLLAQGFSNADISDRLIISPNTVKRHVAHLFEKLEVTSRTQALVRARSLGLV